MDAPQRNAGAGGSPDGEKGETTDAVTKDSSTPRADVILRAALAYAAGGTPVFPCRPDKRPYTRQGFKDASTDPEQLAKWWEAHPDALIGIPTGATSGFWAIDLDVKPGIDGWDSWRDLCAKHGEQPDTREVRTPSGGSHLYFKYTGQPIRCSAGALGLGIDVRGDGGYLIAPPSPGYEFELSTEPAPAEATEWLTRRVSGRTEPTPKEPSERGTEDAFNAAEAMAAILAGSPLHDSLRGLAAHWASMGLTDDYAINTLRDLMDRSAARTARPEEWLSRRDDIPRLVRTARQYAPTNPEQTGDIPSLADLVLKPIERMAARLAPTCIVKDYLYADVAQLVAPGGTGKTTLVLYEAVCIALGRPLWGLAVETPGKTLIITAEDARERLAARLHQIYGELGLSAEEQAVCDLNILVWDVSGEQRHLVFSADGNIVLTDLADSIVTRFKDQGIAVIYFDPLVSFGASEERVNTNEQMLVTAARRIVKAMQCCVRFVHHTGKGNARDKTVDQYSGRGGSALADGSRMTAVLQTWSADDKNGRRPPSELAPGQEDSISVLARAKLSYSPPNLPLIWIKRSGYAFDYAIDRPKSKEGALLEKAEQIEALLTAEVAERRFYTKNDLETAKERLGMSRTEVREALSALRVSGRVVDAQLPAGLKHGGRSTFLCPRHLADMFGEVTGSGGGK